jgi:hypothetical protein
VIIASCWLLLIDWSKLKPYQGDEWKSFEAFCYQVTDRLYGDKGILTPIDDTGGGDGVEFYLTLSSGEVWGWQAKFYFPSQRLNESSRKTRIKGSLKKALEQHKNLTKWFLCTPTDFTPDEIEWFSNLQTETHKEYPAVSLEHWGDSEFNSQLSSPFLLGIRNYFFGELELCSQWFMNEVNKQLENVGNRFIPTLHVETLPDMDIQCFLNDDEFHTNFESTLNELKSNLEFFDIAIERLKAEEDPQIPEWGKAKQKLLIYANELTSIQKELNRVFVELRNFLSNSLFERIEQVDLSSIEQQLTEKIQAYADIVKDFNTSQAGTEQNPKKVKHNTEQACSSPLNLSREIRDIVRKTKRQLEQTTQHQITVLGDASIGKTHTACWTCFKRTKRSLPAILLLGKHFTKGASIQKQILEQLDIPDNYSWEDFIQALSVAAKVYKTKIPIVIDALDEALQMSIWRDELPGFACGIANHPHIGLIITCRNNYKSEIWPTSESLNITYASGFSPDEVEDAIRKYFDFYKIKADLTFIPFGQFSTPIFLKIFCEKSNRERKYIKEVFLGEQTLLEIFESYIQQCNNVISAKLSRHSSAAIVDEALAKIGKEIWTRKARYIPLSNVVELIDNTSISNLDWPHSLTFALLNEGLLISRDIFDHNESVLFSYNLLGGYLIAKWLMKGKTDSEIDFLISSKEFETYLLSENSNEQHPLYDDILKCFSLLLPAMTHKHLFEYTKKGTAFSSSIEALFESSPEIVGPSAINLVNDLFAKKCNRNPLLKLSIKTMKHPKHPLNIIFWEKVLTNLSLTERDLCWTEIIRENQLTFKEELIRFESKCKSDNLTPSDKEMLSFYARYYLWTLTSTVRDLRDIATMAFYWYGRKFSAEFFELMGKSLGINDPYIPERMLAAGYGISMALQFEIYKSPFSENTLPSVCQRLFELMFKKNAPYATTHYLMRDYALGIIKIALNHNTNALTTDQKQRLLEPFTDGGIRNWGESDEKNTEEYREGSMPVHMDFGNYTLGGLVPGRQNYDDNNPNYRRLKSNFFWRLYNLGYAHDEFAQIDKEIHRYGIFAMSRGANEVGRVDRYGKKYSWIVFFELAGFRKDNGLLPKWDMEERISECDIDPSFPELSNTQIITDDYLGDRSTSVYDWIENYKIDLSQYLQCDSLAGKIGPWVLLDGFINQEDAAAKRGCFIFARGLFLKKEETDKIAQYLTECDPHNDRIPSVPEDYYLFAGEIPWSDKFPYNGLRDIEFLGEKVGKKVPVKKVARLQDGSLVSDTELLSILLNKYRYPSSMSPDKDMEELLSTEKVEMIDETTVEEEVEVQERITYQVFVPVRSYRWEGYHSFLNRAGGTDVPAKELATTFDLCSQAQTFDLFEKNGKIASLSVKYSGTNPGNIQELTYLRKDLLNQFLEKNGYALIWMIWGERELRESDRSERADKMSQPSYKTFKDVKVYNSS